MSRHINSTDKKKSKSVYKSFFYQLLQDLFCKQKKREGRTVEQGQLMITISPYRKKEKRNFEIHIYNSLDKQQLLWLYILSRKERRIANFVF